jgi:D-alanyl-D-alanine endopeptidase (penicillin-binding protein 7)
MQQRTMKWMRRVAVAVLGGVMLVPPVGVLQSEAEAATKKPRASSARKTGASTTVRKTARKSTVRKTTKKRTVRRATTRRYSSSRSRARAARLARARAARYQRELRELQTPLYRVGSDGALIPDVRAEAAIIYNPVTREVLWEENANSPRSIASITKVMTAIVFLENEFDLDRVVAVDPVDMRGASTTYLRGNEQLAVRDLLHLLLIASDNAAARTLARVSPFGPDGFIDRMNVKAKELGLEATHYADASGLYADNVSSALDMAQLITFAASDERIAAIMRKPSHTFTTSRRTLSINNTNKLVGTDGVDVRGGKTGFIRKAGYCLATLLQLPQTNQQVAVVVLGARSNAGRFMETKHLFNWIATKTQAVFGPAAGAAPQPE